MIHKCYNLKKFSLFTQFLYKVTGLTNSTFLYYNAISTEMYYLLRRSDMISNTILMEQLDKYYAVWHKYNYVYEEWAKTHGLSVNSLLVLCAIHDGEDDCTQKKSVKSGSYRSRQSTWFLKILSAKDL